jgi:hypothetical protein
MRKQVIIFILLIIFFLLIYLIFTLYLSNSNLTPAPKKTLLEDKGNFCVSVAEKAVANRQAIVEFQKYEILADKGMVMHKCMEDNGFEENPAWLIENKKIIQEKIKESQISEDEALENLKRDTMYIFTNPYKKPLFWRQP